MLSVRTFGCLFLILLGGCSGEGPASPTPSEPPAATLARAGWSFGFCLDVCQGELVWDGVQTTYSVSRRDGTVVARNRGALTSAGQARLSGLERGLPADLQPVYGCPDCADGGASFVSLRDGESERQSSYEFGRPPAVLAELDQFLTDVMDALSRCQASGLVSLEATCSPIQR